MENPEEILHSLEEFAKMKPKDIPRELEEYLKFVAKTGDPVYQWPAIKSLFREKLINVITEFYESCSSMEIPPCPNVEMFNYDLMKNFILEKLDTFASAPFTLQRICELLTSPQKEYTRIDKYMRALEKNILVVSTMEPGGRRTENGDGVMNGIESDHEHVPEPGNEINVEEMDDSPAWPQNIQTNNHISEPISCDNPEHEYHVSTSNQEIVCVQYVSVEPLASDGLQIPSDVSKESDISEDISVTITALNVKKGDENQEEISTPDSTSQLAPDILKETTVTVNEQEIEKTEQETKMDLQTIEPRKNEIKDVSEDISKHIDSTISSEPLIEDILPISTSEKPSKDPDQIQATSESENAETERVSPEISVTSSENSPNQSNTSNDALSNDASSDAPSKDPNLENTINPKEPCEVSEQKLENEEIKETKEILETDSPGDVNPTTKILDDKIITENIKAKESNDCKTVIPKVESEEKSALVVDTEKASEKAKGDGSEVCEETFVTDTSKVLDEIPKIETTSEVLLSEVLLQEEPKTEEAAEFISEEILKSTEPVETKQEVPAEIKSSEILVTSEEKETPMEVDVIPEDSLDSNEKDKSTLEEPETAESPV